MNGNSAERTAAAGSPPRGLNDSTASRLIDRGDEFAALLAAANASSCSLVLVQGEAGMGKTSLVNEFTAWMRKTRRPTYVGHCYALREPFPFMPLIEVLRSARDDLPRPSELNPVAGALRGLVPELQGSLPAAPAPLGDPWAERHRVFRGALELLAALQPATVVFEDVHWADENTSDFVRFLVPQLPSRLGLVLTYRPEDLTEPLAALCSQAPPESFTAHLELAPLDASGVRALMSTILDVRVPDDLAELIRGRTGGIPFAVEEVARSLRERRPLLEEHGWSAQEITRLAVPAALRDSILERIARLSTDAQQICRAAAVIGTPASEQLLARTARLPAGRGGQALSETLSIALLHEIGPDSYDFRHSLAAIAVYESIPPPARRRLHVRAARALGGDSDPPALAQMARHYKKGGEQEDWLRTAEAAADRLLELGDDEAASRLLVDVVSADGLPPAIRGRLAVKLGNAALNRLVDPAATRVLSSVLSETALPTELAGELHFRLGALLYNEGGQATLARAELMRALPGLRAQPMLAARTKLALALPFSAEEHAGEHLDWLQQAVAAAETTGDPALRRLVRMKRPWILLCLADPEWRWAVDEMPSAAEATRESMAERRDLALAYVNMVQAAVYLGHNDAVDAFLATSRALYPEEHDELLTMPLASTGLVVDWTAGRWNGLEARARGLLNTASAIKLDLIEAELVVGLLLMTKNDLSGATNYLTAAGTSALVSGLIPTFAMASAGLGRIALAKNDAVAAAEHTSRALDVLRRKGTWGWSAEILPIAVEALLRSERQAGAERLVQECARGLSDRDAPAASAALLECRGLLCGASGSISGAVALFTEAERAWRKIRRPYDAALVRESQARVVVRHDPQAAAELMTAAMTDFAELGASLDYKRARAILRDQGFAVASRAGRKGYGSTLSPREAEVAELAAAGRTNQQIAEKLVLSQHTVAKHLLRAMHKLGVRSRKALEAILRDAKND